MNASRLVMNQTDNTKLTKCEDVGWLLIEPAIILHQLSKTIFDGVMIYLEPWIFKFSFPGSLEVLECGKCAIQAWMLVS